jgi:hypothetical protein
MLDAMMHQEQLLIDDVEALLSIFEQATGMLYNTLYVHIHA